jgi:hypothetical protein
MRHTLADYLRKHGCETSYNAYYKSIFPHISLHLEHNKLLYEPMFYTSKEPEFWCKYKVIEVEVNRGVLHCF